MITSMNMSGISNCNEWLFHAINAEINLLKLYYEIYHHLPVVDFCEDRLCFQNQECL